MRRDILKRTIGGILTLISVIVLLVVHSISFAQERTPGYMLAVVGNDNNLSIYDANGQNPFQITSDAESNVRLYHWPTWSTDGRLAFFGVSADSADPYSLGIFVVDEVKVGAKAEVAFKSPDDIFTYAYWAPGDCDSSSSGLGGALANCRNLAVLYTPPADTGELALRLIRDDKGHFSDKIIGQAAPFYYSFSPDGQQLFTYRSNNELGIYDVASGKAVRTLDDIPGDFRAPMWSPLDDRLLFGTVGAKDNLTDLVIGQAAKRQTLLQDQDGPLAFAWSPDATQVASVSGFDKLVITDAKTGKQLASSPQSRVIALFWSPQSDRVAYIAATPEQPEVQTRLRSNGHTPVEQAVGGLSWYVLDVKSGKSRLLTTFLPSSDMVYLLNFFDQFARSHSLWSPDGRYLVYGATDTVGQSNVLLLDTTAIGQPIKVAAGGFGVWSWR
jgi:TolB protein